MQDHMQDDAGNIWEVDAQGNPVRLVKPAASASRGRVFTLPQSPKDLRQEARQDAADRRAEEAADRADRNAERADRTAARVAAAAERTASAQAKPTEFQSKSAGFLGRMMQAEKDFNAVPETDRGGRGIARQAFHNVLPGVENTFVNSSERQQADQAVENFIAASLRQESGASISPAEFDRQYKIFFPASGDTEDTLKQKAAARAQAIAGFRIAAGPLADAAAGTAQQRADNEVSDPATGAVTKPGTNPVDPGALPPANAPGGNDPSPPPDAPQYSVATGQTRAVHNAKVSAQIDAMMNAGASEAVINAALKQQKLAPMDPISYARAKAWMMQNPGKRYYGADINSEEPLTMMEKAAASPIGAGTASFADALTAGTTTALGGDKAKGGLAAMAALHPNASLGGTLLGGVIGAAGGEAALAAKAPTALARYAPRMADAIYGGIAGFNAAEDGEGATGALLGAGAGVLGGVVGERGVRAAGAITRGVANPAVRYLRDRGIPLTAGQTVGDSGFLGRTVKGVEDALTSVPGIGNMIDARRLEGLEGFNRSAFQDAAAPPAPGHANPVTAYGAEGMGQVRQTVGDAYNRTLDPVTIDPGDPLFGADLGMTINAAEAIPNVNSAQDAALAGLRSRFDGAIDPGTGQMSGRGFQEAYRGLARTGRERANSDYGHEVGQVMRQGQDALAGALERQNPGAYDGFIEANAANRRANVLAAALKSGGNQADELITPAQLNRADIASTSRLEGNINSAAGNRPFYDLATAGQEVLPSKLPDSGTAKRAIVGALTTGAFGGTGALMGGGEGAGYGTGGGLALSAALALGGTRGGQRALTALLADRPDFAISIADQLQNTPAFRRLAGGAGASSMAAYLHSIAAP